LEQRKKPLSDRGTREDQFGECRGRFPRGITPYPFCGDIETVEGWDGIGGEMVFGRKRQAAAGGSHGTETKTVNPGKSQLNAQADKKVGKSSVRIVNALYKSLINGNASSAKLLFDLADGLINCEDPVVMSQLYSYALKLESEHQVAAETLVETEPGEAAS
jgi:hypothetical protein